MTEKVLEDILKEIQKLSERIATVPQYDYDKWNRQSQFTPFRYVEPTQSGTAGSISELMKREGWDG
jgi:hypothetical protein